jgi:hypothetical protein
MGRVKDYFTAQARQPLRGRHQALLRRARLSARG